MATMQQIAELAGVSRSTVSLVLNDRPLAKRIPARTRNKVHAAAKELGYRPNEIAQSLITGKTRELAFITTQMNRQFLVKMLWGAMEAVDQKGYYLKVLPVSSQESHPSILENLLKRNVDGVILQGLDAESTEWFQAQLLGHKIPCCLLGSSFPAQTGLRVVSDDVQGSTDAIQHLVDHGHRKLIFLNGQPDWPAFTIRRDSAKETAARLGAKLTVVDYPEYHPASPIGDDISQERSDITQLLEQELKDNTAIFCPNDVLGVLALQSCQNMGLRVPEDVSIMGYSESILSSYCQPPLTTVTQPHHAMGHEAAVELIEILNKNDARIFERSIEIKLPTGIATGGTVTSI